MKVAIIGATGAVGREMFVDLAESTIKDCEVKAFATPRSEGETIEFRGRPVAVKAYNLSDVRACDYVLMSAGGTFSRENAQPIAKDGGPIVIDNSSAWRMEKDIPLIVPEINGAELKNFTSGIIANPNCVMIPLAICLKPLHEFFGIELVQVASYQSVSGTGKKGIQELSNQLSSYFKFDSTPPVVYEHPIAFNLIPYIGPILENGYCEEEWKVIQELRKVFNDPQLKVMAQTVRVPVFHCHSESVFVQLRKPVTFKNLRKIFEEYEHVQYFGDDLRLEFPTPRSVAGKKEVYLSRLRLLNGEKEGQWLQFWNVSDNLKKGAATNAVQILEYLVRNSTTR